MRRNYQQKGNMRAVLCTRFASRLSKFMGLPLQFRQYRICLQCRRPRFDPWVQKIPWRRAWLPTPVFLSGGSHGQRSLVGYSPQTCKESDMTEVTEHARTHAHIFFIPSISFSLSVSFMKGKQNLHRICLQLMLHVVGRCILSSWPIPSSQSAKCTHMMQNGKVQVPCKPVQSLFCHSWLNQMQTPEL